MIANKYEKNWLDDDDEQIKDLDCNKGEGKQKAYIIEERQ